MRGLFSKDWSLLLFSILENSLIWFPHQPGEMRGKKPKCFLLWGLEECCCASSPVVQQCICHKLSPQLFIPVAIHSMYLNGFPRCSLSAWNLILMKLCNSLSALRVVYISWGCQIIFCLTHTFTTAQVVSFPDFSDISLQGEWHKLLHACWKWD